MFKEILISGLLTNPSKLAKVLDTVGNAMTVDTGGISIGDWIYAVRGIGGNAITTTKTNNGQYDSKTLPGIGSPRSADRHQPAPAAIRLTRQRRLRHFHAPDWVIQS
jgi:hypothetical protein